MSQHLFKTVITALSLVVLSACVTETTNPVFNVGPSEEEELANYLQLTTGYLEEDDLVNAKRHLANAADIEPNNSEISAIWALIYTREGEMDLADRNFRHSLRIESDNSQARSLRQNYLTLIQFYNLGHNPRSLLIGASLEQARENEERARQYGEILRATFPVSAEYQSYLELISNWCTA